MEGAESTRSFFLILLPVFVLLSCANFLGESGTHGGRKRILGHFASWLVFVVSFFGLIGLFLVLLLGWSVLFGSLLSSSISLSLSCGSFSLNGCRFCLHLLFLSLSLGSFGFLLLSRLFSSSLGLSACLLFFLSLALPLSLSFCFLTSFLFLFSLTLSLSFSLGFLAQSLCLSFSGSLSLSACLLLFFGLALLLSLSFGLGFEASLLGCLLLDAFPLSFSGLSLCFACLLFLLCSLSCSSLCLHFGLLLLLLALGSCGFLCGS